MERQSCDLSISVGAWAFEARYDRVASSINESRGLGGSTCSTGDLSDSFSDGGDSFCTAGAGVLCSSLLIPITTSDATIPNTITSVMVATIARLGRKRRFAGRGNAGR